MSRTSIVILIIGCTFVGCSGDTDFDGELFSLDGGLTSTGTEQLDSLFAHFPERMLAPSECDTTGNVVAARRIVDSMTLRRRIAQLIVVPLDPGHDGQASTEAMQMVAQGVGGFQIPRLMHPEDIAIQTAILQYQADIPLFFAADYERGVGRFNNSFTELPSNMGIGATGNPVFAAAAGRLTGIEARSIGVNFLFAPVVDVNTNPANPIINIRAYGDSPVNVTNFAAAFIDEVERFGVISTVKHFPGHGSSSVDSHSDIPRVDVGLAELEAVDLVPFRKLLSRTNPPGAIMIGHIAATAMDKSGSPASLSNSVITGQLRQSEKFEGLIITDDLRMDAVARRYALEERLLMSLRAGTDILLTPERPLVAIDLIQRAIEAGELDEEIVNRAAYRIVTAKLNRCIDSPNVRHDVPYIRSEAPGQPIANIIAARAITIINGEHLRVPVPESTSLLQLANFEGAQSIEHAMKLFEPLDVETDKRPELAAVILYARLREGRGSAGMLPGQMASIRDHLQSAGMQVVIILGNPYLAREFRFGIPVVVGYDQSESTVNAILAVLAGTEMAHGHLPFEDSKAE